MKTAAALRDAFFTDDKPQPGVDLSSLGSAMFLVSLFAVSSLGSSAVDPISLDWFVCVVLTMGSEPFPFDSLNSR